MKKILSIAVLLIIPALNLLGANPKITSKEIVFRYENSTAREVKLLLSTDQFKTIFYLDKIKDTSSWELRLSLSNPDFQLKPGKYLYRFIVDNVYISDPVNPNYRTDPYIGKISYFFVKKALIAFDQNPQKIGPLKYRFYFRDNEGWTKVKEIMLVGTFNHWQPYSVFLKKAGEDIWYVDFTFEKAGIYYYQYVINGKWKRDMGNPQMITNRNGEVYSVVRVEE